MVWRLSVAHRPQFCLFGLAFEPKGTGAGGPGCSSYSCTSWSSDPDARYRPWLAQRTQLTACSWNVSVASSSNVATSSGPAGASDQSLTKLSARQPVSQSVRGPPHPSHGHTDARSPPPAVATIRCVGCASMP